GVDAEADAALPAHLAQQQPAGRADVLLAPAVAVLVAEPLEGVEVMAEGEFPGRRRGGGVGAGLVGGGEVGGGRGGVGPSGSAAGAYLHYGACRHPGGTALRPSSSGIWLRTRPPPGKVIVAVATLPDRRKETTMSPRIDRRRFLQGGAAGAALLAGAPAL